MMVSAIKNNKIFLAALSAAIFFSCKKEPVILKKEKFEITIDANRLTEDVINLVNDTVYVIPSNLTIRAGQELLIEAGTLIKVRNNVSISINSDGKIIANGNITNPIVFTSDAVKGTAGYTGNNWDGIALNGFGGTGVNSMTYVRIEFAGGLYNASLSLRDIDSTAILNNIQVSYSFAKPSFEISGGNFNASNLVSYASAGTDFSISNGYTGLLQNIIAYRHPVFATDGYQLGGVIIQGGGTFPSISNLSVIGPELQPGTSYVYNYTDSNSSGRRVASLFVTDGAKFHIRNSVLSGFPKTGFYIGDPGSGTSLQFGESDFTYSFVHSNDTSRAFYIPDNLVPSNPPVTANDFKNFMLQPQFFNQLILNTSEYQFSDPYSYDYGINPSPKQTSPLLNGANFDGPVFDNSFFQKLSYRGALGAENWLQGWTNFIPLQTDYNN